ncbi:hypothetical protein ACFLYQ_05410, partial [Chloroflexota bacterium]
CEPVSDAEVEWTRELQTENPMESRRVGFDGEGTVNRTQGIPRLNRGAPDKDGCFTPFTTN